MKAAVFYGPRQPLRVEEVETPHPGPGEVLVRVAACGVCHTDLGYIDHGVPTYRKPPLILGHEASGVVEEVGQEVEAFRTGDRVVIGGASCGECELCRSGRGNACERLMWLGNNLDGAYAEFVKVPANFLVPLPPELPLVESCQLADAVLTAFHAVVDRGRARPGDVVAVFGCGGVGINVVQIAAMMGAHVIAVDVVESKLELARRMGAVEVINAKQVEDVAKQIRKQTGGVDVAFEAIGSPKTVEQAFASVKTGGRVCVVGYSPRPVSLDAGRLMYREIEMVGTLGGHMFDVPKLIELARRGKIDLKPLISHRFPLEEINAALDALRRGGEGFTRAAVIPNELE